MRSAQSNPLSYINSLSSFSRAKSSLSFVKKKRLGRAAGWVRREEGKEGEERGGGKRGSREGAQMQKIQNIEQR